MNCPICNSVMDTTNYEQSTEHECPNCGYEQSIQKCKCGSGEEPYWEHDAQGIPLEKVCDKCKDEKLKKYRPCILSGYDQSDVDEPINPEE